MGVIVTTGRQWIHASLAVLAGGASIALYATLPAHRHPVAGFGYVVLSLATAVVSLMMAAYWRKVHRGACGIASQLQRMAKSGQFGLVMGDGSEDLSRVTRPLNEFLTSAHARVLNLEQQIRELEIRLRCSEAETRRFESVLRSISDAVLVSNRFDEVIWANEPAEKLLGFRFVEGERKSLDAAVRDQELRRLIRECRGSVGPGRRVAEPVLDGRAFSASLTGVRGAEGACGVVTVLHDITRQREIGRIKSDFVSHVSHELKTPLATIKAYAELLLDDEIESEDARRESYNVIASQTDRLNRLIDDILNLSRIESGSVRASVEPTDFNEVVRQVLDVASVQAQARGLVLEHRLDPSLGSVSADPDLLFQAVMNLVSNAIKYTPEGGRVEVRTLRDDRRGLLAFEVSDTGLGIPAQDLPHIFEKFYRVRANQKAAKGTGLGLTLTKQIIETMHGGKLRVESEPGKGSLFRMELSAAA
jgi:two-component system phosphate regulon sensor histidine kinase PhoR